MNKSKKLLCGIAFGASLTACGGAAVPEAKLVSAKTSVAAAEAVGAKDEPHAQMHLKMAQDAIVKAETQIADDNNEEATALLERAVVDAELASQLTDEAVQQKAAEAALARLAILQKETAPQGN
jgi:Domain of unknown function (DUF4398)